VTKTSKDHQFESRPQLSCSDWMYVCMFVKNSLHLCLRRKSYSLDCHGGAMGIIIVLKKTTRCGSFHTYTHTCLRHHEV